MKNRYHAIALVVLALVSLLILILAAYVLGPVTSYNQSPDMESFKDPRTWVEDRSLPIGGNLSEDYVSVNVFKATGKRSHTFFDHQTYLRPDGSAASIDLTGSYKGSLSFRNKHFIYRTQVMQIGSEFQLDDDVAQGYAFLDQEGIRYAIHIFVDEDWFLEFGEEQFAVWGRNMSDPSTMKGTDLEFEEIHPDLYYTVVYGNFEWMLYDDPIHGAFFFGDMSREDYLRIQNGEESEYSVIKMV
ncbi:MAG: hypothetical protein ACOCWQ_00860 [Nanoarchaeota archaeon]